MNSQTMQSCSLNADPYADSIFSHNFTFAHHQVQMTPLEVELPVYSRTTVKLCT